MKYKKLQKCRICGNENLIEILNLGDQYLTGVFPKENNNSGITKGPLTLLKCSGENNIVCGLVQLAHSYDLKEMYGFNYGYRSGLNDSMVKHLASKVLRATQLTKISSGDLIIDIGSNDATTLKAYPKSNFNLVGIDPTGKKFKDFYPDEITLIPDFFSSAMIKKIFPNKKAKIITSFSMFYDLEDPISFMREIHEILDDNGIWIFEQCYMPQMLKTISFDTVCHEHLEFYSLKQIKFMCDRVGLSIIDVEFNDVNGGSFSITVKKARAGDTTPKHIEDILSLEIENKLDTLLPYLEFANQAELMRTELVAFVRKAKAEGKLICALGASTKGNVLLQYCKFTPQDISFIGEVNTEKFGSYAPGTLIPIIPEDEVLNMRPDYLIVLPWHFKEFFLNSRKLVGQNLVFPLPKLEVVTRTE
jgi:hypothetical protein